MKTDPKYPITDLAYIKQQAEALSAENDQFQAFIAAIDSETLDAEAFSLSEQISPKINCTSCGNCCKSLMVNIDEAEASNLAKHLGKTREDFDTEFISKGESGRMVINAIPCHFLVGNSCSVYEHRFAGCKEFPAFHVPQLKKRMFTTFMHYDRCPIIFNVIENLKLNLQFKKSEN